MHRSCDADLSDLKIAVGAASVLGLAVTAVACGLLFDGRTAVIGLSLSLWRAADAYAEIGQGALCLGGRLSLAGTLLGARTTISTIAAVGLVVSGGVIVSLLIAGGLRLLLAGLETRYARKQPFAMTSPRRVLGEMFGGVRFASINVAIVAVDALPTILIGRIAGIEAASILTPLGRVRFGMTVVATTLGEISYATLVRVARMPAALLRALARPIGEFVALGALAAVVVLLGAASWLFGELLRDRNGLSTLAVAAGLVIGVANLLSLGLTAAGRVGVIVTGYSLATAVAVLGTAIGGQSPVAFYVAQVAAGVVAMLWFLSVGYADRRPRYADEPRALRPPVSTSAST